MAGVVRLAVTNIKQFCCQQPNKALCDVTKGTVSKNKKNGANKRTTALAVFISERFVYRLVPHIARKC